jgi:hypothetical protein
MSFILDPVASASPTSSEPSLPASFASRVISDRYEDRGRVLIESAAIQSIDLQSTISNAELAEELPRSIKK